MFTTRLNLEVIGEQAYEVVSTLVYENDECIIQVNPKFDFDGASVPQCLWSFGFSPMTGGYQSSACLHDALYASEYFDRKVCDELFLKAMESEGVSYFKRYSMYYAVRAFGGQVWKEHIKEEVNAYRKFITHLSLV